MIGDVLQGMQVFFCAQKNCGMNRDDQGLASVCIVYCHHHKHKHYITSIPRAATFMDANENPKINALAKSIMSPSF